MQSQKDEDYRFILNYQDHLTKMMVLRPLKTKTAEEVAYHLVGIFCNKGSPHVRMVSNATVDVGVVPRVIISSTDHRKRNFGIFVC